MPKIGAPQIGPQKGNFKSKPVKRIKTSELIAKNEKQKMQHKFNKIMRKERNSKAPGNSAKELSVLELAIKKESIYNNQQTEKSEIQSTSKNFRRDPKVFTVKKRAVEVYEKKVEEKKAAAKEFEKKNEEKLNALKKYKKSKKEKFKGLCSRSKSGQILMGNQVDSLLKKIVKNKS